MTPEVRRALLDAADAVERENPWRRQALVTLNEVCKAFPAGTFTPAVIAIHRKIGLLTPWESRTHTTQGQVVAALRAAAGGSDE